MKTVEGVITMLGNATIRSGAVNSFTTYSIVEIGGVILKNVVVNNKLDNFIERALKGAEPVRLSLMKPSVVHTAIAAIEFADGKRYVSKPFSGALIIAPATTAVAALGFLTGGLWPLSVLCVLMGAWLAKPIVDYAGVKGAGGTIL